MSAALAWAPYALVAILLVLTRLKQLPIRRMLESPWLSIHWKYVFDNDAIFGTTVTQVFYSPAFVLLVVAGGSYFLHRMKWPQMKIAISHSARVLLGAGFVLVFTVPMVNVYIKSGVNAAELQSMPIVMAAWVAHHVGPVWPAFSAVIGALGAFIAGSNTVSNLMLAKFQYGVANQLRISPAAVVALQAVGAAAGNMIAIHNVVAASATVGLLGKEGTTVRKTILPTIYYLVVVGLLGLALVYVVDVPGK